MYTLQSSHTSHDRLKGLAHDKGPSISLEDYNAFHHPLLVLEGTDEALYFTYHTKVKALLDSSFSPQYINFPFCLLSPNA
mmetsp:Transcript_28297/g.43540  ORF Transcript_28297/g.43540 Transcript_28297/m.43540 type:complete len:80 (+) Transcript_28297:252-491(+)